MNFKQMFFCGLFFVSLNLIAWQKDGVPIATGPGDQTEPRVVAPEGKDYFYVIWSEVPSDYRRVVEGKFDTKTGKPLWSSPFIVCDTGRNQWNHQIVATISGSLIITFEANFASIGGEYTIYVTKTGSEKTWEWSSKWIKLSSVEATGENPQLCLDGSGEGCYVTWTDYRSGSPDVWAAHVAKDGHVAWELGLGSQPGPSSGASAIVPSGKGALVFWSEQRGDTVGLYGNRIIADSLQWGRYGKLIILNPYPKNFLQVSQGEYSPYYAHPDGKGGAFVLFYGRAQRVDSSGNLLFNPLPEVGASYKNVLTEDCGVVGCYCLSAGFEGYQHVYVAKVSSSGTLPWGDTLRIWTSPVLDTTTYHTPFSSLVSDYVGGCITAIGGWQLKEENDLLIVHTDSSGHNIGEPVMMCNAPGDQQNPLIVQEPSTKGYIVVWKDSRNGNWDIYAAYLDSLLRVGMGENITDQDKKTTSLGVIPNLFKTVTSIQYHISIAGHVDLKVYNALGQVVEVFNAGYKPSGDYSVQWYGKDEKGKELPTGLYFVELRLKSMDRDIRKQQKVILIQNCGGK